MGLFSSKKKGFFVSCCDGFVNIGGLVYSIEFTNLEIKARNKYKEAFPDKGSMLEEFLNNKEYKVKTMQIPNTVDLISRPKPIDTQLVCENAIKKLTSKTVDELRKDDGTKYFEYSTVVDSAMGQRHITFIGYFK